MMGSSNVSRRRRSTPPSNRWPDDTSVFFAPLILSRARSPSCEGDREGPSTLSLTLANPIKNSVS